MRIKMKLIKITIRQILFLIAVGLTLMIGDPALAETTSSRIEETDLKTPEGQGPTDAQDERVTIDFNNVDIGLFIKFMSDLTGLNFVFDERVKGKVTILSPKPISTKEAYKVFESVLEVHGYTTVKSGEIIKIIPSPDARGKNIETMLKEEVVTPGDKVVTQLIPLKHAAPNELKKLLTPLVSKNSVILSYPPTNMIVITDVYSNIKRLLKIIREIDVSDIGQQITVVQLEYSDAVKLARTLDTIFKAQPRSKKGDPGKILKFVPDERTNSIIIFGSAADTDRSKSLISLLDTKSPRSKDNIHVYYLENATAEELAEVLQNVPSKKDAQVKGKRTAVFSDEVRISADKSTNSLIIMAESDDYQVLEGIIEKLDIPRSMVYIECLLMEVSMDKDFNLGTEWRAMKEGRHNDDVFGAGGGFSGTNNYSSLNGLLAGTLPGGFSMGVFNEVIQIAGVNYANLAAIVQAFKRDQDVNILSTPQILTTDNEEAIITVGENRPYMTRAGTTSTTETYESYEYRDVGISLKITPHISKDRMVRLKINQEITKLDELSNTGDLRPTTLKRTIDTTVLVNDKNTVVIGGLIDNSFSETEDKVPILGDIPILGWLFKYSSESRERTNLFIFIQPHVVKNPVEAQKLYKEKKEEIDRIKEGKISKQEKNPEESSLSITRETSTLR